LKLVKCVVWDLDNTLWQGTLLEDAVVTPRPAAVDLIKVLDARGILHSIASRNDPERALGKLRDIGLAEYFLYPQIGWGEKVEALKTIAATLNIGLDALAFVDDDPFERDGVRYALPTVLCLDSARLDDIAARPELRPTHVTADARARRLRYLQDAERTGQEAAFSGSTEAFLATLALVLTIKSAGEADLARAEELIARTNQLNATGRAFSLTELRNFIRSEQYSLLVARLEDRYGDYGTIGVALIDRGAEVWLLRLLLVSCRVLSRGVGRLLLGEVMRRARSAGVRLTADFVDNGRNRALYVTYRLAGFREVERVGATALLEADLACSEAPPEYLTVRSES
jgi:FkbH-like protein